MKLQQSAGNDKDRQNASTKVGNSVAGKYGAMDILTSVGEVFYDWSIADDIIRWSGNTKEVLNVPSMELIASGQKFNALLDPENLTTPRETVVNASGVDTGTGVPFQIEYEVMPLGIGGEERLWVEDTGRWFSGSDGRPATAHGVLRVINARHESERKQAYSSRFDWLTGLMNRARLIEISMKLFKPASVCGPGVPSW